jgi:NAD(P)H-dependent FMN reductase/ketosteroid isomerase-like protein
VAEALIELAPKSLDCTTIEIGGLPLYNEDLDGKPPAVWARFREAVKDCDALLFLTPEYNRSIPGGLKNAIDVGSRPQGESVFDGMPAGVVSVTPYKMGAFGANHALRQTFVFLNMPVMQQPEAYIGGAGDLFDKKDALKSKETRVFFGKFMTAFAHWVETIRATSPQRDFAGFMKIREQAAAAYVRGDAAPLDAMLPGTGAAGFFPPNGGSVQGAKAVAARYDKDAKSFSPGGTSKLEVLQSDASGELAFWTGVQTAKVRMGGGKKKIAMKLRITELFRFQDGGWKLIHRHADPAVSAKNSG